MIFFLPCWTPCAYLASPQSKKLSQSPVREVAMRTLTQKAAMAFGVVFLLVGLLGLFIPGGMGMEAHPDQAPRLLGLFPVNLLHNVVHLAFGAWGIAASRSHSASRG